MPRALVTRPAPLAGRTARRLAELGYTPVVLSLTEVRRIEVDPGRIPADAGMVAATSANAIVNAPPGLLRRLRGLPCLAVGAATASAARAAGFGSVSEGPGDAAGLARMIAAGVKGGTVVYLCGRVRRPDFELALGAAGIEAAPVETYDTVRMPLDEGRAVTAVGGEPLDAALVYSAAAAEALGELAGRPAFAGIFRNTAFCCLSERIAAGLGAAPGRKILAAAEPTEEALLSLLAKPGRRSHHPSSFLAPVV
jgi:uroporphyrinogen-III synthase